MAEIKKSCIYIVSGGSGASGEQMVQTILAQFPDTHLDVVTIPHVRLEKQIDDIVAVASKEGSIIVLTLVDESLNRYLIRQAEKHGVFYIDLMRNLLRKVSEITGSPPVGHPGLYRKLHKAYFDRVTAIEYTMAHDDGKDPLGWKDSEIMLIGVSRVGKTPLSLYLSVLGWKVANVPLIPDLEIPSSLFQLDPRRIIGLTMQAGQLLIHRQHRQRRLGIYSSSTYADPEAIRKEIEFFKDMMIQRGISLIDVTNKPLETNADEVMRIITRRLGEQNRRE
jgi:hypothetical protein